VDAFDDDYHAALVISNDSDLRYPVQVVRDKFSKRVIIANPDSGNRTMLPGFKKTIIQEEDLEACQLPAKLQDSNGKWIERPEKWAPK
jgi:hypothetical protein